MLGLYQAAVQLGLQAEGYEADTASLRECEDIWVLHVVKENHLQHFVVCYGFDEQAGAFLIGDPADQEVTRMAPEELADIWKSRSLLLLKPTSQLKSETDQRSRRWHWIRRLVRDDLNILGLALVLGIAVAILGLATAIFSQKLIDDILPSNDRLRLFAGVGLLLALLLARSFLSFLRQLLLLRQSRDFNVRIINYFYGNLLHLPKPFFDNRKTGDLIARMNDTQYIQRTISTLVSSAMIDVLMVLVATVAIFWYDWQVGLVALVWIPLFAYVVYRFHRPQLLLLDEPTAALDRDTEHFVLDLLGRLREEMGIILCTHRLKTARRADRIYIIEHGRIERQGRHR